ncbi:MAG: C69 family dipeptidase [Bacteroidales bacterium]|nr:C69 family dipeptidase [Bacteroidales bacterium]
MKKISLTLILVFLLVGINLNTNACTNFLITKGASVDGSTMISYAADSHVLFGELYHWPAAKYEKGTMLDIYEWDTGKYLGKIMQAQETYNVVGNMNEYQVAIGETTYGGLKELQKQPDAIMDYGSLMYIALQRSKTAREAIKIMTELVAEHGYYSHGESFSISDANEVWIMEMIGKGEGEKGAVWVARRIPDGYVCAHANQARIRTFPLANGKTSITFAEINKIFEPDIECVYATDIISFAREKNLFDGKDKDFSFSDTYAPVDFGGARFCEVRVWAMFRQINSGMEKYYDYASGHNLKNRMPLWVKAERKISVDEMLDFMRDHLEGTPLDMTKDVGAGPFACPYRWRPLSWEVDEVKYCNERATATQQTGFSFVTQSRSWLPNPIGGIFWFSVDDAASSVYIPIYCGITKVPEAYERGNGSMMDFSFDAAFWVFNLVSNFAYTRYSYIYPEIRTKQVELENKFIEEIPEIDKKAEKLYASDKNAAIEYITNYSVKQGNETVETWLKLYKYLFTKYMDGNIKKTKDGKFLDNGTDVVKYPDQPGYGEKWYKLIIEKTGDHFKMSGDPGH